MNNTSFPIIPNQTQTIIFDMDGLLVDSEPLWKLAEKKVFGNYGLQLTDDLLRQVMGFRLSEVVQYWYRYQPWENFNAEQTEREIIEYMIEAIQTHAQALPGVREVLEQYASAGYKLAVASSSAMVLIETVVKKLGIASYFELLYSAEFEPYGKPHPGIFIHAAHKLNTASHQCVVLEDSINGVVAGKAARMFCVAVPEHISYNDPRFAIADAKIPSLVHLLK